MYKLTYYFFYALSLLPLWVLYGIAEFAYFLLFHLVGYRKEVVWTNLKNAFPLKSDDELKRIRRQFYRCFMQNWVETIKLISISKEALNKRVTSNWDAVKEVYEKYPRVQLLAGHCFNWEWASANICLQQPYQLLTVYMHITNPVMDKLFLDIRSRFGAKPVRAGEMARQMLPYRSSKYVLGLVADQSPPNPFQSYWVNFLQQPTPFVKGPERNARAAGLPVFYMSTRRVKRGHYHIEAELFCEDPAATAEGELTRRYARRLEQDIISSPYNYLWTHKRWKLKWDRKYEKLWMDKKPLPEEQ